MTTHLCGAGMAFLGFGLSLIIGLWVENSFVTVVSRGIVVLFLFYIIGCFLAGLGQKVIVENFEAEAEVIKAGRSATGTAAAAEEKANETTSAESAEPT